MVQGAPHLLEVVGAEVGVLVADSLAGAADVVEETLEGLILLVYEGVK